MSESPYTGYVEHWTELFTRLMRAKVQAKSAGDALLTAKTEYDAALQELNVAQNLITTEIDKECKDAPVVSFWGGGTPK